MTREAFTQHEKTLKWWSKLPDRQVWVIGCSFVGDWKLESNPNWYSDQIIVAADKYADRRKAAAEGKQMQVSYDEGKHWYDKLTRKITWSDSQWVRVKPEPEFKVGDWMMDNRYIFKCEDIINERPCTIKPDEPNKGCRTSYKDAVPWSPKEGEWCVFYKSTYKHTFKVAKYTDSISKKYAVCEPFIGSIPDNFKD